MSQHTIEIPVDLTNPGHFFACCGLLELADRLDQDSMGHFAKGSFIIRSQADFHAIKCSLVATECESLEKEDLYTPALILDGKVNLRLDWWQDNRAGGKSLKTWAGQQRVQVIFDLMRRATESVYKPEDLLDFATTVYDVSDGKAKAKSASPFYFDARRSATALDIGFSPDVQNMSVVAFPAVESLGLIGLQRFRPSQNKTKRFEFSAWQAPLPAAVAAPAAAIGFADGDLYSFATASRGGDYLKMFTPSKLERSSYE
jgi:CRISPR-associated protein Csb3